MIYVTKANGEIEEFLPHKLIQSLKEAGASDKLANSIYDKIKPSLVNGITTQKIYRQAFQILKSRPEPLAARYKLGRAITQLGPSGYPFERFVGELWKNDGYEVQVGIIQEGKCISHEIDVIATKEKEVHFVECKFHRNHQTKNGTQTALYVNARYHDLRAAWLRTHGEEWDTKGWLITNTGFSRDCAIYGSCAGLHLMGWDHPSNNCLKTWIEDARLHPITALTTLRKKEMEELLEHDLVLCRQLVHRRDLLEKIGLSQKRIHRVLHEAEELCAIC